MKAPVVVQTVPARAWKHDMGLNKKGKDGSRQLALQLFPHAADMLRCAPLGFQASELISRHPENLKDSKS